MLDLRQLEYLVTIAERGTLSAAAEALRLSQPALTRAMHRLEDSVGLSLFDRGKNRMALNEAGKLAVERAKIVLESAADMERRMADYARSQSTLSVGACAPGPLWLLTPQLSTRFPGMTLATEMKDSAALTEGLLSGQYQIIITERPVEHEKILCRPTVHERLFLSLPPAHPLAKREGVYLVDLDGQTMLLFSELGVWQNLLNRKAQGVHFIVQTERNAMNDLITASALPSFSTNLTQRLATSTLNRVNIPILDEEADIQFYLCVLRGNRALIDGLE